MLKNIKLHVEKDEEIQAELEAKLAEHIKVTHSQNINAFQRHIPSLLPYLRTARSQSISIFCNKWGEYNLVDYGLGRTFYGFHPKEEVYEHLRQFLNNSLYVSLSDETEQTTDKEITTKLVSQGYDENLLNTVPKLKKLLSYPAMPTSVECLAVMGCGLGIHLEELVENYDIKHLIIYEAEDQYFAASTLVTDWKKVLDTAKSKGTGLYFQIGKDGRDLLKDIQELESHFSISGFYLYKHYNHVVHDSVQSDLLKHSWQDIANRGLHFVMQEDANHYCPSWTTGIDFKNWHLPQQDDTQYQNNLTAFQRYYPNIYAEFKEHKSEHWVTMKSTEGEINVIQADKLVTWYSDSPKTDSLKNLEGYAAQPHKDGLVLGYKGKKLAHYIHYQFVKETEKILEELEDEQGALPEEIESIILFGLGVGYQLEELIAEHKVENLFICEPNRDFFYASLFAINWGTVLCQLDSTGGRVYLNIGDDGSNLIRDLINQFHNIGPYILANTYFYQSYYNACLNTAIAQLREQLQIMISMGEYFDHAFYGIAHTKEMISKGAPLLVNSPSKYLSFEDKSVPVFIVGNGPSLDTSINTIKEWQDHAIIVSCGTALQPLHKNGITPDFQAEIEQNRTTFDWACLIDAPEYLKEISLISCNGIHPDTCNLYKDVYICFKEGESSTVSAQTILGEKNYQVLKHAFPTVSNFVVDLFSNLGFESIYFMGVDLGFVNVKQHHSKDSGYYEEDGDEVFDYAEQNNTSVVVPGNFRKRVNTKHEFKVSKQTIEQVVLRKKKYQTFYNCSDGAFIQGTSPLNIENLLITGYPTNKATVLRKIKNICFENAQSKSFSKRFDEKFDREQLKKEVEALIQFQDSNIEDIDELQTLIREQKKLLHKSYASGTSLFFYYLYGTVNYSNTIFTKVNSYKLGEDNSSKLKKASNKYWKETLEKISGIIGADFEMFDTSSFSEEKRTRALAKRTLNNSKILINSDSLDFSRSIFSIKNQRYNLTQNKIIFNNTTLQNKEEFDIVINYLENDRGKFLYGSKSTIVVSKTCDMNAEKNRGICYVPLLESEKNELTSNFFYASTALKLASCLYEECVVLPKFIVLSEPNILSEISKEIIREKIPINYKDYIVIYNKNTRFDIISLCGTRGVIINKELNDKDLIYRTVSLEELDRAKIKQAQLIEDVSDNDIGIYAELN